VGNRSVRAVARAPFDRAHYAALAGMIRVYPRFRENLWRFLTGRGDYPYRCGVRTPLGVVAPLLHTSHDISTVNEIFCRRDYEAQADVRVVVDIGSNIGISALYFLTRNREARCYLFEPNPRNVARLRENLDAFAVRYELQECAVGVENGEVDFGVEPTGRYGGIGVPSDDVIRVRCRDVNDVLDEILEREALIDILKLDTEGLEPATVAAIRPDLLPRIGVIYFESNDPTPLHVESFANTFRAQTNRLVNRRPASGRTR
jgi:FkbM family methyltransferase